MVIQGNTLNFNLFLKLSKYKPFSSPKELICQKILGFPSNSTSFVFIIIGYSVPLYFKVLLLQKYSWNLLYVSETKLS